MHLQAEYFYFGIHKYKTLGCEQHRHHQNQRGSRRGTPDEGRTTIEGLVGRRADLKASLVLAGRRGDAAFLTTPPSHYEKA